MSVDEPVFEHFDSTRDRWPVLAGELHLWLLPYLRGGSSADALRPCIARYLDVDETALQMGLSTAGKPRLVSPSSSLRFSASHSGDALLLSFVHLNEIGVDIERAKPRPRTLELARRYFASAEADALAKLPQEMRETGFYRLWTAKEALLKGLGRGIAHGLDRVEFTFGRDALELVDLQRVQQTFDSDLAWNLRESTPIAGYRAAVAWSGPTRRVCAWRIDP